ncbi:EutP/PduV family microcompartment system protein [Desulfovibrio sp. OttesenSCG-928-F07]|nr:EutP/PduV family microcompartment system protein [Desulfovibrio sp. OttesenSCG-928-F07]
MQKVLLIGALASGKEELINALTGKSITHACAMSIEAHGHFINTPGEFLENRRFYRALITAAANCEAIWFIQSALATSCLFPPQFSGAFNRPVKGIVTRATAPGANPKQAVHFLQLAGAGNITLTNAATMLGINELTSCKS